MRLFMITVVALSALALAGAQEPPNAEPEEDLSKLMLGVDQKGHVGQVVDFDFTKDGKKLFTLSEDNTLQVWDTATREHLATLRLPWTQVGTGKKGTVVRWAQKSSTLLVAPDGKTLAVTLSKTGGTNDYELVLVQPETGRMLHLPGLGKGGNLSRQRGVPLSFSHDGDVVSAGLGGPARVLVWRDLLQAWQPGAAPLALWKKWDLTGNYANEAQVAPRGDKLAASANIPKLVISPIHVWNLTRPEAVGVKIRPATGKPKPPLHAREIAWSPQGTRLAAIGGTKGQPELLVWTAEGLLLRRTSISAHPVFRNEDEVFLERRVNEDNVRKLVVSRWDLKTGKIQEELPVAIPAEADSWKPSPDYKKLAICNSAKVISLLDLTPGAKPEPLYTRAAQPHFAQSANGHKVAWTGKDRKTLVAGINLDTCESLSAAELKLESFERPRELPFKRGTVTISWKKISFTLFASGQDWVVCTREGYFAATPGGEKLAGWYINNGLNRLASFVPLERFRKKLYRPDVVRRVLEKGSVAVALQVANALRGKDTPTVELDQQLPPQAELRIVDQAKDGQKMTVQISAEARAKGQPIVALRVLLDGRPLPGGAGVKEFDPGQPKANAEFVLEIPPGKHTLAALARSEDSSALSEPLTVQHQAVAQQPVLHLLAIGIDDYNNGIPKLNCAANDARDLAKAFPLVQQGQLFREVKTHTLLNQAATTTAITQKLAELRPQVKEADVLVVFFAGHGVREGPDFYLLTANADLKDLSKTALAGKALSKSLCDLRCQVLLLLDACHSGAVVQNLRPATDDAARALADDEVGVTVLAAAMGHEKALEKDGNGYFTAAIKEALAGNERVPRNFRDHRLYVHHLYGYVLDVVAERSNQRQHPFFTPPSSAVPYPLRQFDRK